MRFQRLLAGACAVAGVAVLAGPGWALLTASLVLFVLPESPRVQAAVVSTRWMAAAVWRWLLAGRRQAVAAAAMPLAIVAVAVGLGLALGAGWGLAAAGAVVGGLSLAADRSE